MPRPRFHHPSVAGCHANRVTGPLPGKVEPRLGGGGEGMIRGVHTALIFERPMKTVTVADAQADWWGALQAITAEQEKRGFIGNVAEIERDDEGYDERMKEIEKHTVSRD